MHGNRKMTPRRLALVLTAASLASVAAPAWAQRDAERGAPPREEARLAADDDRRPGPGDRRPGDPRRPIDDELAETIQELMIVRLRTHLDLSAAQEEKVVPLAQELAELRRRRGRERGEGMRSIMALAQDSGVDERLLRERLETFYAQESDFRRQEERLAGELRSHLDPHQQARLLVFEERFRGEMRRRMDEMRQRRGGPDRPGFGPGPGGRPRPPRGERPGGFPRR